MHTALAHPLFSPSGRQATVKMWARFLRSDVTLSMTAKSSISRLIQFESLPRNGVIRIWKPLRLLQCSVPLRKYWIGPALKTTIHQWIRGYSCIWGGGTRRAVNHHRQGMATAMERPNLWLSPSNWYWRHWHRLPPDQKRGNVLSVRILEVSDANKIMSTRDADTLFNTIKALRLEAVKSQR